MSGLFSVDPWVAAGIPKRGRPRRFETPQQMIDRAVEYFEYCKANTISEEVLFVSGAQTKSHPLPFLQKGLLLFLGINDKTYYEYRSGWRDKALVENPALYQEGDMTFSDACAWIDQVIATQKISGAMVGMFNAQIVGRVLGLVERSEISGPDGGPIQTEDVSARELLADRINRLALRSRPEGAPVEPDGKAGE